MLDQNHIKTKPERNTRSAVKEESRQGDQKYQRYYVSCFLKTMTVTVPEHEIIIAQTAEQRQQCYDVV